LTIEDGVESIGLALRNPGQFANEIWNVVTVNATLKEIVETVQQIYPSAPVQYIEGLASDRISFTTANEKIRRAGFVPRGNLQVSFEQVRDHLDQVSLANQRWYERGTDLASSWLADTER
jgi:hypothetical protein